MNNYLKYCYSVKQLNEVKNTLSIAAMCWEGYEREEATLSIEVAAKIADALGVSLDYPVGNTDVLLDKSILDKVVAIQKLPDEDKTHIMYSLDGLIQHAKTRMAYK